ncbi:hypothetical protein DAT35_37455 [Vitiosangium sp. GDMCC 1.1324]|nr:hypothetical protein DAT35_37455 [Vitiosangium sp. GDMCC 1.1324]
MASAVIVEHRAEFIPQLSELSGREVKDPKSFVKEYTASVLGGSDIAGRTPSNDDIRRFIRRRDASSQQALQPREALPPSPQGIEPSPTPAETPSLDVETCFDTGAAQPQPPRPESTLDLLSLVTTVDIPSEVICDFGILARMLDPRSWGPSLFWPEVFQEELAPNGQEFTRDITNRTAIGTSWEGFLFENVEWNWNTNRAASFQNHLRIKYAVDTHARAIRLDFALYACAGSQIFVIVQNGGLNVDSGFQCVQSLPSPPGSRFRLRTVKNIRYSDLLDRRIPNEGPAGNGQALSYLAPAIVGLWMNQLLQSLEC